VALGGDAACEAGRRVTEAAISALGQDDEDPQGVLQANVLQLTRGSVDELDVLGQ